MSARVGLGIDVHPFSDDRLHPLVLGGVNIDGVNGLRGHSDADVIAHAITDALLGAAGLGDMGEHFPDTDAAWAGADSIEMLRAAVALVEELRFCIGNVDCTVLAEAPKLAPYREQMVEKLTAAVGAPVNVKATRAERLGAIGRSEGIACMAVVIIDQG